MIFEGWVARRRVFDQDKMCWGDWDYTTGRSSSSNPMIYTTEGRAKVALKNNFINYRADYSKDYYEVVDLPDGSYEVFSYKARPGIDSFIGKFQEEVLPVKVVEK